MPYTLNGIGTHYYGSGNRSARIGTCKSCGRSATLSSYDTREWFCVIFIPIIPLTRYRILDDCSSCRKHHRVKASEFASQLSAAVGPLRVAVRRAPSDPEPVLSLIRTLLGWEMRGEAQKELQDARARFPQNLDLLLIDADMAVDAADYNRALPLYERASSLDPQNNAVAYSYGWLLHQMGRHQDAVPILQRALSDDAFRRGGTYLLGVSFMKLGRWNEALNSFQQLLALEPAYLNDKALMRLVRDCKQHLGYELSDAERRAGRRWWPFGRSSKRATALQSQPTLVRPSLRWAGLAILVLMLIGGGYYAWDRKTNIPVYFDSGMNQAVQVELDGRRFDLPRSSPRLETLREGQHRVVVREGGGKEIEQLSFRIDELPVLDFLQTDRFFVYNVGARRVYRRSVHGYAARAEDASYSEELIGMQRFFEQRDVDYPFQAPPSTLSVDSSASSVRKIAFNAADNIDLSTFAMIRLQEGRAKEAKEAIDLAAKNDPCDTLTRRRQMMVASTAASSADAAVSVARQWIGDCAADDLEAHRAYQDVNEEAGRQAELRAEYQKLAEASPASAKAHYLYGRVIAEPEKAVAEYQQAIALDPKMSWPHVALGYAYRSMDRHEDALREFGASLDVEGRDSSAVAYYAMEAIATGTPESAVAKVDEIRKKSGSDYAVLEARWMLAVATADWVAAETLQKQLVPVEGPEAAWWRQVKLLRIKADVSVEDKIGGGMRDEALRALAGQAQAEHLIEKGDASAAVESLSKNVKLLSPASAALLDAYAAANLLLQGKAAEAQQALAAADELLKGVEESSNKRSIQAVIAGLRGAVPVESVLTVTRDNNGLEHGWFVAGVRAAMGNDRRRAAECFDRSLRAASNLEFPYLEAKALVAAYGPSAGSAAHE